jgi:CheY-like chemotaxis protein
MVEPAASEQNAFNGSRALRILIAEDNPADVRLVRYALQSTGQGVELQIARDGAQALEMLFEAARSGRELDLLLLDINLPKYDGYEILGRIREDEWLRTLPVIVLSTSPADVIEEGLNRVNAHVAGFYSKPPDLDEYPRLGQQILDSFFHGSSAKAS